MLKSQNHKLIKDSYKQLKTVKNTAGTFHKVLFHLHTPASYDYKFLENSKGKLWNAYTEEEILQLCKEKGFEIAENLDVTRERYSDRYTSQKELMTYYLLANELFINEYELVVVSDHHTIDGFDKLNFALQDLYEHKYKNASKKLYPELLLGIEISCTDCNHVVGIIKCNEENKTRLRKYIASYIVDEKNGSYLNSYDVLKSFFKAGGLAYIAHIYSSNLFKSKDDSSNRVVFSGLYRKLLLLSPYFQFVGVHKREDVEKMKHQLKKYGLKKEIPFVLDSDSHSIDTIGSTYFWIKGFKCNFDMVKEAIIDADISIDLVKPTVPSAYITGLLAQGNSFAFLKGAESHDFCISFSSAFNCFIGGRGTGKSTVIHMIEAVLGQFFSYEAILEAIFEYDYIWLRCMQNNEEFLVGFYSLGDDEAGKKLFELYKDLWERENLHRILPMNIWDTLKIKRPSLNYNIHGRLRDKIIQDCIHIFKIIYIKNDVQEFKEMTSTKEKVDFLEKFFGQTYSINELIQNSQGSERINRYLHNILYSQTSNDVLSQKRIKNKKQLSTLLKDMGRLLSEHKKEIIENINNINANKNFSGKLRISYQWNLLKKNLFSFKDLINQEMLFHSVRMKEESPWGGKASRETHFFFVMDNKRYNLEYDKLIMFLDDCCKKLGVCGFFLACIDSAQGIRQLIQSVDINDYLTPAHGSEFIDNEINKLGENEIERALALIINQLWRNHLDDIIELFKNKYIRYGDNLTLEFNIENREDTQHRKDNFMDVTKLSMGQKVVAMLTFILGYSEYSNDYRPLVLDQPEDNLDSQYIYKNLVDVLRAVKNTRQVIVATHNATLVTNAKADQVIVLESNGKYGWVKASGHPNELKIKRHIINYLEGGAESFLHKEKIYKQVLDEYKKQINKPRKILSEVKL